MTRRRRIVFLLIFLLFCVSEILSVAWEHNSGLHARSADPTILPTVLAVAIGLTALSSAYPWLMQTGVIPWFSRGRLFRRLKSETFFLALCYSLLYSPLLYGRPALALGMPYWGFYLLAGVAILNGFGWGLYNLKASQASG